MPMLEMIGLSSLMTHVIAGAVVGCSAGYGVSRS